MEISCNIIIPKDTECYTITLGVDSGFGDNITNTTRMTNDIFDKIRKAQAKVKDMTGIYISTAIAENVIIYDEEWGCPSTGERCLSLSITRNPQFEKNADDFNHAVVLLAKELKRIFDQTTVTLTANIARIYYLKYPNNNKLELSDTDDVDLL